MFSCTAIISVSGIALGIGCYLYTIAASKCIKGSQFLIGRCTTKHTNQNILDQFIEFIEFHSNVKQLSRREF